MRYRPNSTDGMLAALGVVVLLAGVEWLFSLALPAHFI